jgi:hypothetical protein
MSEREGVNLVLPSGMGEKEGRSMVSLNSLGLMSENLVVP